MKPIRSLALLLSATMLAPAAEEGWKDLLDDSLSQWEVHMGVPHKTVVIPGGPVSTSENGTKGTPLGLNQDPLKVFTTIQEDGQTVLHVSGQIYAGLSTKEEFGDYHLSLEMKWGEKKWEPRLTDRRDSGVLIHATGPHGKFWNVWMASLECQIQEHDCGDFIGLSGPSAMIRVGPSPEPDKRLMYDPEAEAQRTSAYTNARTDADKPNGEWNTIEIYTVGDDAIFVVNGTVNMALSDAMIDGKPLTMGKIQLQSEAAEVFYRNLRIRPLKAFPEEFAEHLSE
ncbi:DUF1080 domain-containing protein [Haloferula chungangensis]|uniref:DUF1080 domain-containing protein n=1 Tax=Haloferula chungangensis TaxID=1048331 RepID=A0ABW2L6Z1_9BACT